MQTPRHPGTLGLALLALLTIGLALGPSGLLPLHAQQPVEAAGDTLERSLIATLSADSGRADSTVIILSRDGRYVAELSGGATFSLVSVRRPDRPALIVELPTTGSGKEEFEVYARDNGEHVLRILARSWSRGATLALWSDARAARKAEAVSRAEREATWGIGITAGIGLHSAYSLEPTEIGASAGNVDFEVGLLFGSNSPFSGSVGYAHDGRGELEYTISWFYLEPRFRIKKVALHGEGRGDVGISFRLAQGNASDRQVDPSMLAPGLFLTQHFGSGSRGFSVTLAYAYRLLRNVSQLSEANHHRVGLSVGWLP